MWLTRPARLNTHGFPANQFPHQREIAYIRFDQFDIVLNGFDVESVSPACGIERIHNRDRGTQFHEANCEIASDETQTAG